MDEQRQQRKSGATEPRPAFGRWSGAMNETTTGLTVTNSEVRYSRSYEPERPHRHQIPASPPFLIRCRSVFRKCRSSDKP
jgi:hypothetical protein